MKTENISPYIENRRIVDIDYVEPEHLFNFIEEKLTRRFPDGFPIRWAITGADISKNKLTVEATFIRNKKYPFNADYRLKEIHAIKDNPRYVLLVTPTGVGAAIGGGTGDNTPAAILLGSVFDLITHPNVLNAAGSNFIDQIKNRVLYAEGAMIDSLEKIFLFPAVNHRIGVIIDSGVDEFGKRNIKNTIIAARATMGLDILEPTETEKPLGCKAVRLVSGAFSGTVENIEDLISAGKKLKTDGATALAVATHIEADEEDLKKYFNPATDFPNPYGALEAIISHLLVYCCGLPAAHGPALTKEQFELFQKLTEKKFNQYAATEVISGTAFLMCVLIGLRHAPHIVRTEEFFRNPVLAAKSVGLKNIAAVVLPYSCMGGPPALMALKYGIPIIAVKNNKTVISVTPESLNLIEGKHYVCAANYRETVGIAQCIMHGISQSAVIR